MPTDLTEHGLERLICKALTGDPCDPPSGRPVGMPSPGFGGVGWSPGNHHDYDREHCVDDDGVRSDGLTTETRRRMRELRRENRRLRMERDIRKEAAAWFARESGSIPGGDMRS